MQALIRRQHWLFPVLLIASLPACVDYQETLRLLNDGRIELEIYATVVKATLPFLAQRSEWKGILLLPSTLEEARKSYAMGMKIKRWMIEEGAGVVVYDLAVTIENPPALSQAIREIQSSQKIEIYLDEEGKIRYRREIPPFGSESLPPFFLGMLRDRLENSRLVFRLIAPAGILKTNGLSPNEEEVIWETKLSELRTRGLVMMAILRAPTVLDRFSWLKPLLVGGGVFMLALIVFRFAFRGRRGKRSLSFSSSEERSSRESS
jgi:hypothetical protein